MRMSLTAPRSAAREQKLREDPLVEVHGPVDVTCRRCGTDIKLSTRSTYDAFHWHRHIKRCIKRPEKVIQHMQEGKANERRKRSSLSKLKLKPKPKPMPHSGALMTKSRQSLRPRSRLSDVTPALTPDREDDVRGNAIMKSLTPQSLASSGILSTPQSETPMEMPQRKEDIAFEEYLLRSRRRLTGDFTPLSLESGRSWSWAQLKEPVWAIPLFCNGDGGGLFDGSGLPSNVDLLPPTESDIIIGT